MNPNLLYIVQVQQNLEMTPQIHMNLLGVLQYPVHFLVIILVVLLVVPILV